MYGKNRTGNFLKTKRKAKKLIKASPDTSAITDGILRFAMITSRAGQDGAVEYPGVGWPSADQRQLIAPGPGCETVWGLRFDQSEPRTHEFICSTIIILGVV